MLFTRLREDIDNVFAKDPAARSVAEVILCYPGLHALWMHRIAHFFWRRRFRLLARFLSHISRFLTGIEIHPGAVIGRRFFIDHGSGVVVGETAEIGNDVLLYQGVVLGGTSLKKEKRHPTIGDGVVIGSGAVVLGAVTIGNNTKIGSGSVVVKSVPPGVTVIGVPGKVVKNGSKPAIDLEHGRLPDPVARAIDNLLAEQEQLKDRIKRLENLNNNAALPDKGEVTLREKEYELNRSGKL
jgi:serine O-acetyltransferase